MLKTHFSDNSLFIIIIIILYLYLNFVLSIHLSVVFSFIVQKPLSAERKILKEYSAVINSTNAFHPDFTVFIKVTKSTKVKSGS